MSMTTYEGRISRPLTVRIFPEVTAEEAALLMSTAQSSSSSLDETSCVSVLLSVLQTPAPLPHVVAGSQGYTQRACNQLSCQALNHLFSPEGYFQAAWPRKDNVSEPRSKINADISEQLAQPPAWPLAPCPWDNTSSSPRTWIWLLYLRNSFLPRRALAAPCTNGISQLQATWSLTVMVLLFSIPRSGSYGEKTRDGRNKRSKELPTHISFNYILAAIPFLLLAARSGAWL